MRCGRFLCARDVRARAEEKIMKKHYFTKAELVLWIGSAALIVAAFCIWDRVNFLTLAASLIGVTSLIFCAKGNPVGQVLIIIFAVLYGIISWMVAYYGEMITYVGMTAPMAVYALIVWLKNPFAGKRSEVKVNRLRAREYFIMALIAAAVTVAFYFTARRSPFYALAYAANDVVLIVLWSMAAVADPACLSVVICFCVFLVNDLYGFVNWMRMQRRQARAEA